VTIANFSSLAALDQNLINFSPTPLFLGQYCISEMATSQSHEALSSQFSGISQKTGISK